MQLTMETMYKFHMNNIFVVNIYFIGQMVLLGLFYKSILKIKSQKIFVNWKPLLWFVKGSKRRNYIEYVRDLVESTPPEKALHEWAKPVTEAAYYIKHLTLEGDTVMDPMMGSGTTGVVAINLKRKFIGIEIDKERFEIGKKRIMRDTSLSSS